MRQHAGMPSSAKRDVLHTPRRQNIYFTFGDGLPSAAKIGFLPHRRRRIMRIFRITRRFCHSAAQQCLPVRAKMRWLERRASPPRRRPVQSPGREAIVARVKQITSSPRTHPGRLSPHTALLVAPAVTVISLFASGLWPYNSAVLSAMASRNVCTPVIGAYWLAPAQRGTPDAPANISAHQNPGNLGEVNGVVLLRGRSSA